MEITYELTQKDFFDSIIAHRNARWSFRIALGIALLSGAVFVVVIVAQPALRTTTNAVTTVALIAFLVLCTWIAPWRAARNQFRRQPSAHGPRTLTLDSKGMHWRWDGGAADVEWKNVTRYLEAKDGFLLYVSPAVFNMVPKRALSASQLNDLRSLLAAHVPEPKHSPS